MTLGTSVAFISVCLLSCWSRGADAQLAQRLVLRVPTLTIPSFSGPSRVPDERVDVDDASTEFASRDRLEISPGPRGLMIIGIGALIAPAIGLPFMRLFEYGPSYCTAYGDRTYFRSIVATYAVSTILIGAALLTAGLLLRKGRRGGRRHLLRLLGGAAAFGLTHAGSSVAIIMVGGISSGCYDS